MRNINGTNIKNRLKSPKRPIKSAEKIKYIVHFTSLGKALCNFLRKYIVQQRNKLNIVIVINVLLVKKYLP